MNSELLAAIANKEAKDRRKASRAEARRAIGDSIRQGERLDRFFRTTSEAARDKQPMLARAQDGTKREGVQGHGKDRSSPPDLAAVADLIPPQDSSLAAAICGNPARTVMAIVIDQQTASHLQQSAATYETTPFYRNALSHAFSAKNKSLQGITGKSLSPLAKRRRRQARRLPETCRKMLCVTKTGRKRHVGDTILSFRKSALRLVDPQRKHVMIRR